MRAFTSTKEPTEKQLEDHITRSQHEDKIRDAIFHAVPYVNRRLANKLPVAYDRDNDVYVVNDYNARKQYTKDTSKHRKGQSTGRGHDSTHDIPIEIKIRYNADIGEYEVTHFNFRDSSDRTLQKDLESWLN